MPPWVTATPASTPRFAVCLADPPGRQGRPRSEGDSHYCSVTQDGASLALGYYLSPRRGFQFARYARKSPNDPSSATRPARAFACNLDAMAGFAAAHG